MIYVQEDSPSRTGQAFSCIPRLALLLLLICLYALPAWSASQKTSFLPLNIHSSRDSTTLQAKTDSELQTALASTSITVLIPRERSGKTRQLSRSLAAFGKDSPGTRRRDRFGEYWRPVILPLSAVK